MNFQIGGIARWRFVYPEWWPDEFERRSHPVQIMRITRIEPDENCGSNKIWGYLGDQPEEGYIHARDDGWIEDEQSCPMQQ